MGNFISTASLFIGDPAIIKDPAFICTFDNPPAFYGDPTLIGDPAFIGSFTVLALYTKLLVPAISRDEFSVETSRSRDGLETSRIGLVSNKILIVSDRCVSGIISVSEQYVSVSA